MEANTGGGGGGIPYAKHWRCREGGKSGSRGPALVRCPVGMVFGVGLRVGAACAAPDPAP